MGFKPWRTLSALVAFSAFMVGCTNGPQRDKSIGATNGFSPPGAQAQQPFPKFDPNATNSQQKSTSLPPFSSQTGLQTGSSSLNSNPFGPSNIQQVGASGMQPPTGPLPPLPSQPTANNVNPQPPSPFGQPPLPPGGFAGDRLQQNPGPPSPFPVQR
jgi:hypothetical protein